MAFDFITGKIAKQKSQHLYRQLHCMEALDGKYISVAGQHFVNFSSNDYLGLNNHPLINKALIQGAERFGASSASSSLVTGYHYAHQALEAAICDWLNKPEAMLFNSGFSANEAVLSALGQENTLYLLDKLSHASIIDGALKSNATTKRFLHNNYQQLNQLCETHTNQDKLLISEGVFSMDGDCSDVDTFVNIANSHNAMTYLDEAHSVGVLGGQGQGIGINCDIVMATFGKALSTSGAFIACDESLKEYLVNFSRHYIYSTAMSPAMAWASKQAIEITQSEGWRRDKIKSLSTLFKNQLDSSIELLPTQSSIHAIVLKEEQKALSASQKLKEKGFWVTAIRPPTVAKGTSRLRITICTSHNDNDINQLALTLNEVLV